MMLGINVQSDYTNSAKQRGYNQGEELGELAMDRNLLGYGLVNTPHPEFPEFGAQTQAHLSLDHVEPQIPPCGMDSELMIKTVTEGGSPSFDILNKYGSRCRRLHGQPMNLPTDCTLVSSLPIKTMIQLAAENFIHTNTNSPVRNELSVLTHPYPLSMLYHSEQDSQDIQLIQHLLSCVEKVSKKQYERAYKLLLEYDRIASSQGTPVQRLVFYFTEALHEKIDRETGRITPKGLGKKVENPLEALHSPDTTQITFHKEIPISQITKFAGIQAVVDNIGGATKVHFIDLDIRKGIQCTILMQALAARREHPIDHLKITAVGTQSNSKESIEETGRHLMSFAESLDLKFSFEIALAEDIRDLNAILFQLNADEVIAVYAAFTLTHMISKPDQLKHLMEVIRDMNPCAVVVAEVEANCNSLNFVDRYVEALSFYGAWFECMADCLQNEEQHRSLAEKTCFNSSIRNVIASEGEERRIWHISIGVWRAFFMQFGFEETKLSMSSMYQAHLVLKNFMSGDSFTFDVDGKSLIIGWKGTPLSSLSAWKFQCPK